MTKLAQGAVDLHSSRSQVDFDGLAEMMDMPVLRDANTALEAFEIAGEFLSQTMAVHALERVQNLYPQINFDTVVIDRAGKIIGRAGA
jgi:cobalt-precorrin-5B (C1)-methyltransferase